MKIIIINFQNVQPYISCEKEFHPHHPVDMEDFQK